MYIFFLIARKGEGNMFNLILFAMSGWWGRLNCYGFATGDPDLYYPGLDSRQGKLLRRPIQTPVFSEAVRADLEPRGWTVLQQPGGGAGCGSNSSVWIKGFLSSSRTQFHFIRSEDAGATWIHKRGFRGRVETRTRAVPDYGFFHFPHLAVQACL